MDKSELIRLVQSLSGSEKRNFKLYCKKQAGNKDYMELFNIINESDRKCELDSLKIEFKKRNPDKSFDNTSQYLFQNITNSLIQVRALNDKWFQQYFNLMRAKVLFERSLIKEGHKELKKVQSISLSLQDNIMYYQACRFELNFLSDDDFLELSDQDLIDKQMKSKSTLKLMLQTHEQNSLFEVLRHRIVNLGVSLSDNDTPKLNDLILGELNLSTRGSVIDFESQKIHLSFQSFFFINIGDYKSSLKSFIELNNVFEKNSSKWNYPPYDYLSILEGILDNLRTISYYTDMQYFINKLEILSKKKYPGNFEVVINQVIVIYKLCILINTNKVEEAIQVIFALPSLIFHIINQEMLDELYFYIGLTFYKAKDLSKANKYIGEILSLKKSNFNSPVRKSSRLLHTIIHYELDNSNYLDYTIRSYKRAFKKNGKFLKIEELLLKIIKLDPKRRSKSQNSFSLRKVKIELSEIECNKYEKQILKYYDFGSWIKEQLI